MKGNGVRQSAGAAKPGKRRSAARLLRGALLLLGLALGWGAGAQAACTQLDGMRVPELDASLVDPDKVLLGAVAQQAELLTAIYRRIAAASRIRPALLLCNDRILNAVAFGSPDKGMIRFYTPMLEFLKGNPDEIAAVMAHEFAHLVLNHAQQRANAANNLGGWAQRVAQDHYRRNGSEKAAVQHAVDLGVAEFAKFSRDQEREADDKGFSLAVTLAKFNSEGARSLAVKLGKLPHAQRPPYLESHPGWLERYEKADLLALNQDYIGRASAALQRGDWPVLSATVERWLRDIPASGAAWYYKGRWLARTSKSRAKISQTFEASLSNYVENSTLGVRSQEDQSELDDAWFYLCLALFDEGYAYESASCSRRIGSEEKRLAFQKRTFRSTLIVGGDDRQTGSDLLVARGSTGGKLITNDRSLALGRGEYQTLAPDWKVIRFPDLRR